MKIYKTILALDPSGNFKEGKGTTGFSVLNAETGVFEKTGHISASEFDTMERYWYQHILLLELFKNTNTIIVIEDYLLYNHKKECQVNSRLETPQLIGAIKLWCWENRLPYHIQTAAEVKNRWTNEILEHKGIIQKKGRGYAVNNLSVNRHCLDSIRHATHFNTFRNGGLK